MAQQQHQHMPPSYPSPALNYSYNVYANMPIYANGAVDLGSIFVPVSMSMDGIHTGNYLQS